MYTLAAFGWEFGIEFWTPPLEYKRWQFARERDESGDRLYWFGPIHFAICPLGKRRTPSLDY